PEAARLLEGAVDWAGVFHRVQGNPLLLRRALDRVARLAGHASGGTAPGFDPADLPTTFEDLFQEIYDEVAQKRGGPAAAGGRQRARLLQLLSVAREPLGFEALGGLLAAGGEPLPL